MDGSSCAGCGSPASETRSGIPVCAACAGATIQRLSTTCGLHDERGAGRHQTPRFGILWDYDAVKINVESLTRIGNPDTVSVSLTPTHIVISNEGNLRVLRMLKQNTWFKISTPGLRSRLREIGITKTPKSVVAVVEDKRRLLVPLSAYRYA